MSDEPFFHPLGTEKTPKYKAVGLRIHDFEIIAIGRANGITQIATVNTKDFKGVEEISIIGL